MNIGVIGAGQLAQMLAQAGEKLQMDFTFLSPDKAACAAPYGKHLLYPYQDSTAIEMLEAWSDIITFEFENIPASTVKTLEKNKTVHPSSLALETASDRLNEKKLFDRLNIATAKYETIDNIESLKKAVLKVGYPCVLKTRREGYDGKGQAVLKDERDIEFAWDKVGQVPCILEEMVNFKREISIIAARNADGQLAIYPLAENYHRTGILRLSFSLQDDPLQSQAEKLIEKTMNELNYVGVLAIELFDAATGIIANEMSPRVHNSGHWTMNGADVSQFENHLLAISNQKLRKPNCSERTAMVNLIGTVPAREKLEKIAGATVYEYGKSERDGRKLGHVNISGDQLSKNQFFDSVKETLMLVGESELAGLVDSQKQS